MTTNNPWKSGHAYAGGEYIGFRNAREATWDAEGWTMGEAPAPDPSVVRAGIDAERDRRLTADFLFMGKMYQRDPESVKRIGFAATLAGFAMGAGAQPSDLFWHGDENPFVWIASDNSLTPMDAQTTLAFGQAAAAVETRLIFAAKALRDANPIPEDYTDDKWWP